MGLVGGDASPRFPNPYNMRDKGMVKPYMAKTFGIKSHSNHMMGYVIQPYNYYPGMLSLQVSNLRSAQLTILI